MIMPAYINNILISSVTYKTIKKVDLQLDKISALLLNNAYLNRLKYMFDKSWIGKISDINIRGYTGILSNSKIVMKIVKIYAAVVEYFSRSFSKIVFSRITSFADKVNFKRILEASLFYRLVWRR